MENEEKDKNDALNEYYNQELTNEELLGSGGFSWSKIKAKLINIVLDISFFVLLFVLGTNTAFSSIYENSEISGASMKPTFNANITIKNDPLNEMAVYKPYKSYTYGDVIISNHNGTLVIKRIIAMSGDRVKIDEINGEYCILLNGEVLDEPYIDYRYALNVQNKIRFESLYNDDKFGCKKYFDNEGYLVIPEGYFFYVGDNRTNSSDCIEYGPQPMSDIQGKVVYKYPSSYVDDVWKLFWTKVVVVYGNIFNNLEPNF